MNVAISCTPNTKICTIICTIYKQKTPEALLLKAFIFKAAVGVGVEPTRGS